MASIAQVSRNAARKQRYAALAGEHDKDARNAALEKALGEGAENLTDVTDGFERVIVGYEDGGPVYARRPKVVKRKTIIAPEMPTTGPRPGSRSAKRAALKARRVRKVRTIKHRLGPCGNIGCAACREAR